MTVVQRFGKLQAFLDGAVDARFDFAFGDQAARKAKDCGNWPAVGFGCEPISKIFDGDLHPVACLRIDEAEDVLFGFVDTCAVRTEEPAFRLYRFVDIGLGITDTAQHREIGVDFVDQGLERLANALLSILSTDLQFVTPDEKSGASH